MIIPAQYSLKLCSVQTCLLCFNEEKQAWLDNYWIRDQDEEKSWWILKMKMLSQFIKWSFKLWITELYRFHNYCWRIILRAFILLIINYGTHTLNMISSLIIHLSITYSNFAPPCFLKLVKFPLFLWTINIIY